MHDVPYFDRFAPLYDVLLPETEAAPLEAGLDLVDGPVETVVDLGGGTGRASRAIAAETLIFDASQPMLTEAEANGYPTVLGDVRSVPIMNDSVDAVVSVDAVHHLPNVEEVCREIARILRPGGIFVVRDFDPTTVRGRGLAAAEHLVGFDSTFFSASNLADLMGEAGLDPTIRSEGFVYTVAGKKPDTSES